MNPSHSLDILLVRGTDSNGVGVSTPDSIGVIVSTLDSNGVHVLTPDGNDSQLGHSCSLGTGRYSSKDSL
ncbi:hypothetical protein DPMN_064742 [Dreissena polymorpha]|uniref:Uncharacterized protein n=1 Tax=Dreissena polymorpha TaxID=45954 RepID=A0A9D4CDB2_DREPO|nr:hypothetical protein DPMN_064742 [Dreissena polymorpha]